MTIKDPLKITVGMNIFIVPNNRHGSPYLAEVVKVGRKWAEVKRVGSAGGYTDRMCITNWVLDGKGYTTPGYCYPNEQVWRDKVVLEKTWRALLDSLRYGDARKGVSISDIEAAAKLLGVTLPKQDDE